jgi:hypothetical protein
MSKKTRDSIIIVAVILGLLGLSGYLGWWGVLGKEWSWVWLFWRW